MIPTAESGFTVQSTIEGETTKMGIHEESMSHVMDLLAGVYKDIEMALLREPATNALDSQIGVSELPIEVETPTPLRPTLVIRDTGCGMTKEEIQKIYTMYGASTKRESNEAVGMMGIGSKAPLAYTKQFTITSVKDGMRSVVMIGRDEKGEGATTILDHSPTDAPSGTEVTIPANRNNSFEQKARQFFAFWAPGTVLLNGSEPEKISDPYKLSEKLWVVPASEVPNSHAHNCVVVMGNVPYPINLERLGLPQSYRLIAHIELGRVMPTVPREGLKDLPSTDSLCEELIAEFKRLRKSALARELKKAKTKREALHIALKVISHLGLEREAKWRGLEIPFGDELVPQAKKAEDQITLYTSHNRDHKFYDYTRRTRLAVTGATMESALSAIWVVNYTNKGIAAKTLEKIKRYAEAHNIEWPEDLVRAAWGSSDRVYVTSAPTTLFADWTEPAQIIDYADVRKWRDPEAAVRGAAGAVAEHYNCYITKRDGNGARALNVVKHHPASEIDATAKIYYLAGAAEDNDYATAEILSQVAAGADTESVIVRLPKPRVAKFLRLFPQAEEGGEALRVAAGEWWKALSATERRAVAFWTRYQDTHNGWGARWGNNVMVRASMFGRFDPAKITDPEFKALAKWSRIYAKDFRVRAQWLFPHLDAKIKRPEIPTLKHYAERFPILPVRMFQSVEDKELENVIAHSTSYVNAVAQGAK